MIATDSPVPQFFDLDGSPLNNGSIYFGLPNLNPETNPVTVYWDIAATQPVAQPVKTTNGFITRDGTPANIFAASDYSITVKNKKGQLVIYTALATQFGNAGQIGNVVSDSQTVMLNVPSQYATIQAALDAIKSWVIFGTVKIQVADGTYNLTSGILLNHPYGDRIQLLGNTTFPNNCIIRGTNPPTFDAISCTNGHMFGLLDGFMVDLAAKAGLANNATAVLANNGATIICGPKMKTNNWYYGIAARNGSFISCNYANVNNAGDVGIWAFVGSTIEARYATSTNASDVANGYGFGFQAEYGSALDCSNATASGCNIAGIASLTNSNVRALTATSNSNVGSGFLARDYGTIENHNATANTNTRYGEETIGGSIIFGGGKTLTDNVIAATNGYCYLDNSGALGARIAANGDLRIDNNAAGQTYFNTSGGLQFEVRHLAAAVARIYSQGGGAATGNQPILGTDSATLADVPFRTQAKGAAQHYFNNGQGTQFEIAAGPAATVNHLYVQGSATGGAVVMGATGTDGVIDLALFPKGAGSYLKLGAGYVAGAVVADGYMLVKDNAGTLRKVLVAS